MTVEVPIKRSVTPTEINPLMKGSLDVKFGWHRNSFARRMPFGSVRKIINAGNTNEINHAVKSKPQVFDQLAKYPWQIRRYLSRAIMTTLIPDTQNPTIRNNASQMQPREEFLMLNGPFLYNIGIRGSYLYILVKTRDWQPGKTPHGKRLHSTKCQTMQMTLISNYSDPRNSGL